MICPMKLKDYLREKQISPDEFAEQVGASKFGVLKWVRGERTPRGDAMRKIQEITKGKVTPGDFFGEAA